MIQQLCYGIAVRMEEAIATGQLPNTPATSSLQQFLAQNTKSCFDAFASPSMLLEDQISCPEPDWPERLSGLTWELGQDFGVSIKNPILRLESASIVNASGNGDQSLECMGWSDNDMHFPSLMVHDDAPGFTTMTLQYGELTIVGAQDSSEQQFASATMLGSDGACVVGTCSELSIQVDPLTEQLTVGRLVLRTAPAGGGELSMNLGSGKISLHQPVAAQSTPNGFTVGAHDAVFLISTTVGGEAVSLVATNETPIELNGDEAGLVVGPFTLAWTDGLGEKWNVQVDVGPWWPTSGMPG